MADRNTKIRASQIRDDDLKPTDLASTNSPTDNQVPTFDSATSKFTWEDQASAGTGFTQSFVNADLTSNKITINHALGLTYPLAQVYDNSNQVILPTNITFIDVNNIELDFTGLTPITGTYNVRVG